MVIETKGIAGVAADSDKAGTPRVVIKQDEGSSLAQIPVLTSWSRPGPGEFDYVDKEGLLVRFRVLKANERSNVPVSRILGRVRRLTEEERKGPLS